MTYGHLKSWLISNTIKRETDTYIAFTKQSTIKLTTSDSRLVFNSLQIRSRIATLVTQDIDEGKRELSLWERNYTNLRASTDEAEHDVDRYTDTHIDHERVVE